MVLGCTSPPPEPRLAEKEEREYLAGLVELLVFGAEGWLCTTTEIHSRGYLPAELEALQPLQLAHPSVMGRAVPACTDLPERMPVWHPGVPGECPICHLGPIVPAARFDWDAPFWDSFLGWNAIFSPVTAGLDTGDLYADMRTAHHQLREWIAERIARPLPMGHPALTPWPPSSVRITEEDIVSKFTGRSPTIAQRRLMRRYHCRLGRYARKVWIPEAVALRTRKAAKCRPPRMSSHKVVRTRRSLL